MLKFSIKMVRYIGIFEYSESNMLLILIENQKGLVLSVFK